MKGENKKHKNRIEKTRAGFWLSLPIRRAVVYIGLGLFVLGAHYLIAWANTIMFGEVFSTGAMFTAIAFVPLFLVGFYYLGRKLRKTANKYLFASMYDYQKTLDKFAEDVTSTINLNEVAGVTVRTIQQTMQIDNIGLFVKNKHYEPIKVFGFNEKELTKMVSNPRCRSFITALRKPIVYQELANSNYDYQQPQEEVEHARTQMECLDVAIVLPLITKGELIACVIMGRKISGDAYTQEDMRLLESLANRASISIENARLYNEVQGFNKTLKGKVDDATKRLRELLKIKSDFLTVASHQLRTPTSIVRGMLSLVIEEKDLSAEEREKFISQAYEGVNRLERIIHELLNATELEGKKMRLEFRKTRVENILEEIIHNLEPLAEQIKVKLNFNKPTRPIPKTLTDPVKLKEAVTNVIDNAIHYSPEGKVDVLVRRKQDQIIVEVEDTGIGMSKADLRMLFTKFSRGEGILQIHPNGSGLGLFIAKKMLEAMGGTIAAESKGKSKGSKFTLTLPIK
jgi:signal transduction histidine kinase